MKSTMASGVMARVMRWTRVLNVLMVGAMTGVLLIAGRQASRPDMALVAECIPMNNRFVGPLRPLVSEIIGGVGGLIPMVASIIIIAMLIMGFIQLFKKEDLSGILKGIMAVFLLIIGAIVVLLLLNSTIAVVNGMCKNTYF